MDEEGEEDGCGPEPQRTPLLREEEEQAGRRGHQGDVDDQADEAELGSDGQRSRVRAIAPRRQPRLGLLFARRRLSADADADERMVLEHDPRDSRQACASARRLAG